MLTDEITSLCEYWQTFDLMIEQGLVDGSAEIKKYDFHRDGFHAGTWLQS